MPYPSSTQEALLAAADRFFAALSAKTSPLSLLSYFSSTQPVAIQHCPASCLHPQTSLLRGANAVRSYFDLLETNFIRSDHRVYSSHADPASRSVVLFGSVRWTWKKSRRSWKEEFTCTLVFDEALQIMNFLVRTESGPGTCVMRAVDTDADTQSVGKSWVQMPVSNDVYVPLRDTRLYELPN